MGRQPNKLKQNPKLVQNAMSDGRASLVLEYYLGRTETPVYDDDGNPVLYTTGAMKGKPKYTVKHNRKKEALNLYIWLAPRTAQERQQNKNTLQLAEKIRFEKEQEMLEDRKDTDSREKKSVISCATSKAIQRMRLLQSLYGNRITIHTSALLNILD